ncbi:MBL fold metallo-hydrolase [bacterium]|nr:MAG: MBL fold metallo-hydrolase [bacterium]
MSVHLTFCGGVRTVTGSTHLLSVDSEHVLIDSGLFQGHREDYYKINSQFYFNPAQLDAVVLSHSHIDHSGNLPNLVRNGFRNKVYCTSATKDLCKLMLLDSAKIQEEDIKFVNKINARKGLPLRQPLYSIEDAKGSLKKLRAVAYHKKFKATPHIGCTFYDAGHILGSGNPLFEVGAGRNTIKIAYAVDLGRKDIPLLRDPDNINEADYLIIESTYGGRAHHQIGQAESELAEAINRTIGRGGKVIIPAFALERTQEVVYYLSRLIRGKKIKPIPIYVDSPLACDITDVFLNNTDSFDLQAKEMLKEEADILGVNLIHYIRTADESKKLNFDKRPMIIISTSGMCESGRILHHLRNTIEDARNTIVVVGYMAKNTLGKRIVERFKAVRIFGERFMLKAEVVVINAFSAHADKNDLVEYVLKMKRKPKKIFVVHGDMDQSEALAGNLRDNGLKAYIPRKFETVTLG